MGIGDFLQDVGDAIVPETVENWAGGVAGGANAVWSHLDDVARAGAWAANPTHYDDIARGAGRAAQFVGEHPGQIWDTGFEIGRYMVKDQLLDPKNLAINLAMGAATVATGGGTGGLLAARMINMGRAGGAALKAARGAEEGVSAIRAARAGWQTARATQGAAQVAGAAARGARAGRGVFGKIDDILGAEVKARQGLRSAIPGMNEAGGIMTRSRNVLAGKIAPEGAGLGRQIVAQSVGVSHARPILQDASRGAQFASDMVWRTRRAKMYNERADSISEAGHIGRDIAQAESDPLKFAIRKANEHGYDPVGVARKAATKVATKTAVKALKGGEQQRKPSAYTDMATGGGGAYSGYRAPTYSSPTGGMVMPSGAQARVSGEGYETVSSQLGRIPGRRSNFYSGTNETYADQSEEESEY